MKRTYPLPLLWLVVCLLMQAGCSESPKKSNENEVPKDSITVEEIVDDSESLLTSYDRIKQAVREWNDAIDSHRPDALNTLYADQVECYLNSLSQKECVDRKTQWLQAHSDYRQDVEDLQVYYFDEDTARLVFVAEFNKICKEQGRATVVPASLYFSKFGNDWKIIRETDQATVLARAKKAPISNLKNGKQTFSRSYEADTRDIPGFGHESVFYDFSLYINVGETISGEYILYSGTMRETFRYLIPEGKITDGILEMTVVYNNGEEEITLETYNPDEISADRKERWHLKIINGNELVCLDVDNGYLYGKSLWLVEGD